MGIFKTKTLSEMIDVIKQEFSDENYIEAICVAHAIDLISRTIAATELQVYRYDSKNKKTEEKKDNVYYRLNIKPNINENGTNLKNKLVKQLLTKGKALIVFEKKRNLSVHYMFLAKTYDCSNNVIDGKVFNNVCVEDEEGNSHTFKREFKIDKGECLYFSYKNDKIRNSIEKFNKVSSKLLNITDKAYKTSNVNKWRLKNPGGQPTMIDAETKKEITYEKYKEKITDGLFSEEDSVLLLSEIFDLYLLNKDKSKDLSDHGKLVQEIGDKIAMLFDIPTDVYYGTKTEKSKGNNDFITFACNPIMKTIEDTYNGGLIDEEDFINGEQIRFNRFCMQHLDLTSLGTSLDKLTSIGFSFNQLCRMINIPEVDEDWANEHHVTKNYADVKGGVKEDE